MGGVGSFQRQNRTLYVGRIKETGTGPETEEVVLRHFKEWGDIEKSACPVKALLLYTDSLASSSCTAVPKRRVRHIRVRIERTIREGVDGVPVAGQ